MSVSREKLEWLGFVVTVRDIGRQWSDRAVVHEFHIRAVREGWEPIESILSVDAALTELGEPPQSELDACYAAMLSVAEERVARDIEKSHAER